MQIKLGMSDLDVWRSTPTRLLGTSCAEN